MKDKLYGLCECEIDGNALREMRLILSGHSYLISSPDEEATLLEDCIEGFMWDESEERFEAVKMIVDAGAGLDEWEDETVYTPQLLVLRISPLSAGIPTAAYMLSRLQATS